MNFKTLLPGIDIPNNIYVIVEIPVGNKFIKYEFSKKDNLIYVDRFLKSPIFYPFNYGYINKTLSLDGDELDVVIPINYELHIGSIIECKPIGILFMEDESGEDNKIIALPSDKISKEYININEINELNEDLLNKITFFFENYKILDKDKFSKIIKYENSYFSKCEIIKSIKRYNDKKNE
ncbi:inorganic pyrophosphatase [endosymbiont of Sipalinus gigas]|uniref:inorganic diphosphatase n=1 Tax=endosymbiont of Sipalinus gigas TaxID=1972134 RepID=UPI000DC6E472|nr:inorganic diphosphatase [endosymbiont of Sipalinus gigas]BBA85329.1 inorganic pyrophosphatase [endosymbiont of Sipalinus gigas]